MQHTKTKEVMTKHPEMIDPEATLLEACKKMKDIDCGCLPIGSADNPTGMITDRDIVVRAICDSVDPASAQVKDYMTTTLYTCDEDDTLEEAAEIMNMHDVSRLCVKNKEGRVTGILSFGHILRSNIDNEEVADTVCCATGRKKAA